MDDPLDAVAVHGGAGIVGIMSVPIFMEGGLIYGVTEENTAVLTWNAAGEYLAGREDLLYSHALRLGAGMIAAYNLVAGVVMFGALRVLGLFRIDELTEEKGCDVVKHNEPAYPPGRYQLSH